MNIYKSKENFKKSKSKINKENIDIFKDWVSKADAVVIGAGAGLSTSAGIVYTGERFKNNFSDFIEKYNLTDMYTSGFYRFKTQEEKWAYWSRHIMLNRYEVGPTVVYEDLKRIIKNKEHFIITTNADHQFWISGFEDEKIFATQGDYGLLQCSRACHKTLYSNEEIIMQMISAEKLCKIPSDLVPNCPICGGDMEVNLRKDSTFVEDTKWHEAAMRYSSFIENHSDDNILFIELGVGFNTPAIIKFPFLQMTKSFPKAKYVCINQGQAFAPDYVEGRALCIDTDIGKFLSKL